MEGLNSKRGKEGKKQEIRIIQELRPEYTLSTLLNVSGMSRSTYYYHLSCLYKPDKYKEIKNRIVRINIKNKGRYGYRRITQCLIKDGFKINHKTVSKLMNVMYIKCKVRKKKYKTYKGETGKVAPNILQRDFHSEHPLLKLVTDVTEFSINNKKIFLSAVLDLYNSEIIGYSISHNDNLHLIINNMKMIFKKLSKGNHTILHSDQGTLYKSLWYQRNIAEHGIIQSMSRKGNCYDNAVIENFFGILKSELLYLNDFYSENQFLRELNNYIKYYNNQRIKQKLGGLSPVEYRINHCH
jgi:putative transposase